MSWGSSWTSQATHSQLLDDDETVVCHDTRQARFDWIYDGENVIATAERDDGDGAALYQWWLEEGRGILH